MFMAFLPDSYTLQARLFPALLVGLPVGLAIVAWFPGQFVGWGLVVSITTSCGFGVLLAHFGRDAGKQKEPWLFQLWGGKPTTQLLRHRDIRLDPHTKARYHGKLERLLPDVPAPSTRKESANPDAADQVYASWVKYLLEKTRDVKQYPLIFKENVSYGFRRNLWGWKALGLLLSLASLILCVLAAIRNWNDDTLPGAAIITSILDLFLLLSWIFLIGPNWIHLAAFAYAERLLAACEVLEPPAAAPATP
jgi:hypothetical protein